MYVLDLMKIYNIIFFYFYRSLLKSNWKDFPVFFATMMFSSFQAINIMVVAKVIELILEIKFLPVEASKLLIIYVLVLMPNFIYVYSRKRYDEIIKKLEEADEKTWKRRRFLVILYAALSLIFVYLLAFLS